MTLPYVETFYMSAVDFADAEPNTWMAEARENCGLVWDGSAREPRTDYKQLTGWYYWYCFPGCLPDSDPIGPFDSETAALADARENAGDNDTPDDSEQE